jgi:hypothetical protein
MVGAFFSGRIGGRRMQIRMTDYSDVIAIWCERFQTLAELEIAARVLRRPVMLVCALPGAAGRAMDHLYAAQAGTRNRIGFTQRRPRGDHRFEQRQGHGHAHTA